MVHQHLLNISLDLGGPMNIICLNVGYQKSAFTFIMYENDVKMFMSPRFRILFKESKQAHGKYTSVP